MGIQRRQKILGEWYGKFLMFEGQKSRKISNHYWENIFTNSLVLSVNSEKVQGGYQNPAGFAGKTAVS